MYEKMSGTVYWGTVYWVLFLEQPVMAEGATISSGIA